MNNIIDEQLEQMINRLTSGQDISDAELEQYSKEINSRLGQTEYAIKDSQAKLQASLSSINNEAVRRQAEEIISSDVSNMEKIAKSIEIRKSLQDMYKQTVQEVLDLKNQIMNPTEVQQVPTNAPQIVSTEPKQDLPQPMESHTVQQSVPSPVIPTGTVTPPDFIV